MSARPAAGAALRDALEETLGTRFRDPALLELALTHPSYSYERDGTRGNERLEFLGDAVLDLVVARLLYEAHPDWSEGDLTRTRAALVNAGALAAFARELELGRHARLGRTEQRSGGHEKPSILANLFEAVLGALYLDAGLAPVEALVRRLLGAVLAPSAEPLRRDPKTRLQEWAHAQRLPAPRYRLLSDSGEENAADRFRVRVAVGTAAQGEGAGRTKRAAERAAAAAALAQVEGRPEEGA